jgi:phage baseplate assembly protein W
MSASLGINRHTGAVLTDFDHVRQSLGVILTTRLGSRVMRRTFGSAVPALLGQPLTPGDLMRWYMAIVIAVELWEPRFSVTSLSYPANANSPTQLGQGQFGVTIRGDYRPNALSGDFAVAASVTVIL